MASVRVMAKRKAEKAYGKRHIRRLCWAFERSCMEVIRKSLSEAAEGLKTCFKELEVSFAESIKDYK